MTAYKALALSARDRLDLSKSAYFGDAWNSLKSGLGQTRDNVWNAGAKGLGQMKQDASDGVKSMANTARNAVDNGVRGGLDFVNNNISQPMQQAGQAMSDGVQGMANNARNAVDNGVRSGLDFVNNNISQPMQQAGQAMSDGVQGMANNARNAVDNGFRSGLDAVNRNISAPLYGAINGAAQGYQNANPAPAAMPEPAAAPAAPAAPPRAIPVPGQPDYEAQFHQQNGTRFDPNSSMDRAKMQMLQKGASVLWGDVKDEMEKDAAAKMISKGLGAAGSKLKSLGSAAKGRAGKDTFEALGGRAAKAEFRAGPRVEWWSDGMPLNRRGYSPDLEYAQKGAQGAAKLVGNKRIGIGKALSGAGESLAGNTALQGKINKGLAGVAGAGILGGSHKWSESRGKADGLEEGIAKGTATGATQGYDAGLADASQQAAQSSMDPGVLGRLMEVFTGRQPQTAISATDPAIAARRDAALKRILVGA